MSDQTPDAQTPDTTADRASGALAEGTSQPEAVAEAAVVPEASAGPGPPEAGAPLPGAAPGTVADAAPQTPQDPPPLAPPMIGPGLPEPPTTPLPGTSAPRPDTTDPDQPTEPTPYPPARPAPGTPADRAGRAPVAADFGRVTEDGTVYVRTPEGEREVGSYPGAAPQEALAYFTRKYEEVVAVADLLHRRVTQTDLSAKDAADGLGHLRRAVTDLRAVGDLVALQAKVESIATAVEARRVVESQQRAAARQDALARREEIVAEAERIAGQPESSVQWKTSSARMRALLEEWKAAQRGGPKLDREPEQALWHRLSSSRNSFDKMRRAHFAHLVAAQAAAKTLKEELVAEAEALSTSTNWGATAGAYKRLMGRWREAGRASRADDDALWKRFKAAQDTFFSAKDALAAAEDAEHRRSLAVKETLLAEAQALLPVKNVERAKAALRAIQDKWDTAGRVPRSELDRVERAMRRVEAAVREAEERRWTVTNPEVAARAANLAEQAERSLERHRRDLAKAEASGDERTIARAREALEARRAWLEQARAGLAEFGG